MSAEPKHCQPHSVAEPCAACNTPKTTEAEAIARLREEVETAFSRYREGHPSLDTAFLDVSPNDLRALLDAHAALEREVVKSNHRALELQYLLDDATKRAETAERIDRYNREGFR